MPCRAGSQGGFDLSHQGVIYHQAGSEVQRLDLKYPFLAVGFGIDATDQRIVLLQDRQGEVAIFASGRRVIEVEQVQGLPTVP